MIAHGAKDQLNGEILEPVGRHGAKSAFALLEPVAHDPHPDDLTGVVAHQLYRRDEEAQRQRAWFPLGRALGALLEDVEPLPQ